MISLSIFSPLYYYMFVDFLNINTANESGELKVSQKRNFAV